jgi:hypothetical protein
MTTHPLSHSQRGRATDKTMPSSRSGPTGTIDLYNEKQVQIHVPNNPCLNESHLHLKVDRGLCEECLYLMYHHHPMECNMLKMLSCADLVIHLLN